MKRHYYRLRRAARAVWVALAVVVWASALGSCTQDFRSINTNPLQASELDPRSLLANCQLRIAGEGLQAYSIQYGSLSAVVQHLTPTVFTPFDMYQPVQNSTDRDPWQFLYAGFGNLQSPVRITQDIAALAGSKSEYANVRAAARVLRVFQFHRITDLYGSAPYSEAGKGVVAGSSWTPKYDSQESIYGDMLKELKEAAAAFSQTGGALTNDAMFQGDIARWKRFANSLRLRLAVRISGVASALARQHGEEAIAGGVMTANADNAYIDFIGGDYWYRNTFSPLVYSEDLFALSGTFVETLTALNDPRGAIFSNKTPLVGLPNGISASERAALEAKTKASRPSVHFAPKDNGGAQAYMTCAEVKFLLAEAALLGWTAGGQAKEHYEAGVRAAMTGLSIYPGNPPIPNDAAMDAYLRQAGAAWEQSKALELIHTQKWIALFGDGFEPYAEYRRTGLPRLKKLNPKGNVTGGEFPRRFLYPPSEYLFNRANVEEAAKQAGAGYDAMLARVWWDKNR